MRIDQIILRNFPPIKEFEIRTTSNVVIIAGANGSGKTRLKQAIVTSFRDPNNPIASFTLTATQAEEEAVWKSKLLQVNAGQSCQPLAQYFETRRRAKAYSGTVVQIDSNRAVQPVRFDTLSLATVDPDDEDVNYSWYLESFIGRWQSLVNKIYRKLANRDQKIAKFVKANLDKTGQDAIEQYPDPFVPYQEVFAKLLPGKALEPIDPKNPREFHFRLAAGEPMPFSALSSGEQEVIKVAFDLVWKSITHSVILLDEPELHLHPTLTFRLIETLKEFGGGTNQLILFTHSADLISTYYSTGNVFFIDSKSTGKNQAHQLSELANAHSTMLRAASANLGLFAVGKRLIFVEGREASVDRLVYHKIAQTAFPDAYIMPIGSVENILALRAVVDELTNAIFGIDLFLLRDRDGLSDESIAALQSNVRFSALPRRHVENYLLDADVLGEVARIFYLPPEVQKVDKIKERIFQLASAVIMQSVLWNVREQIRVLSAISQPSVRDVGSMSRDQLAEEIANQLAAQIGSVSAALETSVIKKLVVMEHSKLTSTLASGDWIKVFSGKIIFARFCGEYFNVEPERVREAYADLAMKIKPLVFNDITKIFSSFSRVATPI